MAFYEKYISGQQKYNGKIFKIRLDKVELQNGRIAEREVFEHCGGVGIVAVNENNEYALVRQYRYCVSSELYEIPAGKLDVDGENHRDGALRELREEAGVVPEEFIYLGKIYPSPGCMTETLHIYFARGLKRCGMQLDEDEFLSVEWIHEEKVKQMIADGEITDAKTIAAVMLAQLKIK